MVFTSVSGWISYLKLEGLSSEKGLEASHGWLGLQYSFLAVHPPKSFTQSDAAVKLATEALGGISHLISRMDANTRAIRNRTHKIERATKPGAVRKESTINSSRDT